MSATALALAAVLYLIAAAGEYQDDKGMALALGCYALANVGLIMAAK